MSAQLKEAHVSKKKRMSLGEGVDEAGTLGSPLKRFEISIYKTAVDVAVSEIDRRFSKNKELYRDLAALEPRLFKEIDELLANDKDALSKTYRLANVDQATLREELVAFSKCYDAISSIGTTKSFADIHDETILDNIVAMEHDQADQP